MTIFFIAYFTILFAAYVLVKNTKPARGDLMLNLGGRPLVLKGMAPRTPGEVAAVIELAIEFAQEEQDTKGRFVPRIVRE
jgi:hypothetical protein